jgi:hypothetical protein
MNQIRIYTPTQQLIVDLDRLDRLMRTNYDPIKDKLIRIAWQKSGQTIFMHLENYGSALISIKDLTEYIIKTGNEVLENKVAGIETIHLANNRGNRNWYASSARVTFE